MRNILIIVMLGGLQVVYLCGVAGAQVVLPAVPAGVRTFTAQGFEFSEIDASGNRAFSSDLRPSWYPVQGRGSVAYNYGLARTEVTTAQWMEFVNTFSVQSESFAQFGQPIRWGAKRDPAYNGPGTRWILNPNRHNAEHVPVWGLNWREAAMLCNWLHNGRSSDPTSLTHGAYDTSTFGFPDNNFFNGFTDQVQRSPGAKFWIPSLDEWIKGAFYDAGNDRWWLSHYGSDTHPVYGLPGEPGAQSNAGLEIDPLDQFYYIPLSAYGSQSPYGLLSTSGGTAEWLEDAVGSSDATGLPTYRLFYNSGRIGIDYPDEDLIYGVGATVEIPHSGVPTSIRIATSVPSPGTCFLGVVSIMVFSTRRSRRCKGS